MDIDKDFAVDSDVLVSAIPVGQVIQGEDHGSVGRVLEGHYASSDPTILDLIKDIYRGGSEQLASHRRGGGGSMTSQSIDTRALKLTVYGIHRSQVPFVLWENLPNRL